MTVTQYYTRHEIWLINPSSVQTTRVGIVHFSMWRWRHHGVVGVRLFSLFYLPNADNSSHLQTMQWYEYKMDLTRSTKHQKTAALHHARYDCGDYRLLCKPVTHKEKTCSRSTFPLTNFCKCYGAMHQHLTHDVNNTWGSQSAWCLLTDTNFVREHLQPWR